VIDLLPPVVTGVLGGLVGVVLPAVAHQVPRNEALVRPVWAARCPSCAEPIRGRVVLPVLAAGVCAVLGWRPGPGALLPAFLYLGLVGVALAVIDLEHRRLPNALVLPSYVIGAALLVLAAVVRDESGALLRALVGLVALFALYLLLALLNPAGMGFGDVKLAGVLGLHLGYLGYDILLVGAFLGFLLGALGGLVLILTRRASRRSHIPFGPFMLAGALVAVGWGRPLLEYLAG
jgi:leader peptidase (prepilin peptidase) / N-methyltransferase